MKSIILDSGFWFALYKKDDKFHENAISISDKIELYNIIIPWPTLYEVINTKFTKNQKIVNDFYKYIKRKNITFLPDDMYRADALEMVFKLATSKKPRQISLVDCIIRLIIEDTNNRIDALCTFNPGDFSDICRKNRIETFL